MSIPTEEERKQWWVLVFAHTSFIEALRACNLLLEITRDHTHPLFSPLAIAIHALYCRPFHRQKGAGKLPKAFIQDDWLGIHTALLTFRDSSLVHSDASRIKQIEGPLNEVVYTRAADELSSYSVQVFPLRNHYDAVVAYLPLVIEKAKLELMIIHQKFYEIIPPDDSQYLLNPSGDQVFTPYTKPPRSSNIF